MATKVYRDQMLKLSKEELVRQYHEKAGQLYWYERLESLRGRGTNAFVTLGVDLGEHDKALNGDWMIGEVWAPFAADGGVIVIRYGSVDGADSTHVMGFENYLTAFYRGMVDADGNRSCRASTLGQRVLAERLAIAVDRERKQAA